MHIEDESVYCGKQVTLIIHVCRIEKPLEFQYQSMVNERVTTISTQPWAVKLNINLGTSSIKTSTNVPGRPE